MISAFLPTKIKYNGSQLSSLWAYKNFGILGDSIVAFIGPCNIPKTLMVDVEDIRAKHKICGSLMLHFIIEHFDNDLEKTILRQRLLTTIIKDVLSDYVSAKGGPAGQNFKRIGDDLYTITQDAKRKTQCAASRRDNAKLSISIATASPVSTMIHFAINISTKGTPVKTAGLNDYKIAPKQFALEVMRRYTEEMQTIKHARQKVNWVK
ncbi:MAG: DUF366 family protein [Planctomycetota bacterium]